MKILVVVDMQNDFIDGALGTPEAQAIFPNVVKKVEEYKRNHDFIVYTADTHFSEEYAMSMEGKKLPVMHCIHNTPGWMIPDEIRMGSQNIVRKFTFGARDLPDYIASNYTRYGITEIEVVGLCTDICVISNVMLLKARFPNIKITVDSSCCAGVTPESHQRALEAMKMCHIDIV